MVVSQADLGRAVEVRYAAYKRHAAPFAETLLAPESLDRAPGTVVLLAEDKSDHAPLGTMRIQTNAFEPLVLEQSIALPDWLRSQRLAEATRLGVAHCRICSVELPNETRSSTGVPRPCPALDMRIGPTTPSAS